MILLTHSQPLAAPRLPGVDVGVDAGGIFIGPGDVVGIVGSGGSRKCLALVKV